MKKQSWTILVTLSLLFVLLLGGCTSAAPAPAAEAPATEAAADAPAADAPAAEAPAEAPASDAADTEVSAQASTDDVAAGGDSQG